MAKNKDFTSSLYDFMADTDGLTKEELIAELEDNGIDVKSLEKRVADVLKKCSEERRLAWRIEAKQKREEIENILQSNKLATGISNLKQKIMEILNGNYGSRASSYAEAYFRKKGDLSENDLTTLIEDLENLNLLDKKGNHKD